MPPLFPAYRARPLALFALIACLLAVVAATVSFAAGSWLGLVWVLLAGVTSNMAWYYHRKAKAGGGDT